MQFSPDSIGSSIQNAAQRLRKILSKCAAEAAQAGRTVSKAIADTGRTASKTIADTGRAVGKSASEAVHRAGKHFSKTAQVTGKYTHRRRRRRAVRLNRRTAFYAGLFLCIIICYAAGIVFSAVTSPADAAGAPAPAEGAEAIRGQTEGAEKTPLAKSLQGLLTSSKDTLTGIRQQMEESLRDEYWRILDRGESVSFEDPSSMQRRLFMEVQEERKKELQKDPFLILVNKWHYLPEDYEVEPVMLPNGQSIGATCSDNLQLMLDDCTEAGGTPIVCSGYRAHWLQVDLFAAQVDRWLYAGYSQEEAEMYAATAVAVPGTSEHELGLAADIYSSENMDLDESQIYTFTQQWLMENCWKYGFVLRYPKDKSEITGIIFEPWHYRYVGREHAEKIHRAEICLEEYLGETDHPDETDHEDETEQQEYEEEFQEQEDYGTESQEQQEYETYDQEYPQYGTEHQE